MNLFSSTPPALAHSSAPYDTMAFPDPAGAIKTLTRTEFEKLPLVERVRLLAGGQSRFFRDGEEVSPRAAMKR
jgi:hypothetical protein